MNKRIAFISILLAGLCVVWVAIDVPETRQLQSVNPKTWGIRIVRENQARKEGKEVKSQAVWVPLSRISIDLRNAVIMAEDGDFYRHKGFDFDQLWEAMKTNWERKRFAFGGSTLTQQLARTLFLTPRKSLFRKGREAFIARQLENTLTKDRILELYLNTVEWGVNIYGAEAASRHYFNKPALDLTPMEAISLAIILPSPRKWDPNGDSEFMIRRRQTIYYRMVRAGMLPEPEEEEPVIESENKSIGDWVPED